MAKQSEAEATVSTSGTTLAELWNNGAKEVGAWRFWVEAQETTTLSNATATTMILIAVVHMNFESTYIVSSAAAGRADIGGASTWTYELQLDGSDFLELNVIGAAGDNIDWRVHVEKLN